MAGVQGDGYTKAMMTVDYAHHEVHSGSHYFIDFAIDIPAQDILDMRFTTPDTTKWLHMIISVRTQEEGLFELYENAPILNADTALAASNSNRNSSKISGISNIDYIINTSVANANLDTDISSATKLRFSLLGSNQGNVSGEHRNDNELVLRQGTAYMFRIHNQISSTRYASFVMNWYEHTNNKPQG